MVEREKVVVILLIVTIILSIFSVVLTMTAPKAAASSNVGQGYSNVGPDEGTGKIALQILETPSNSEEGTG